MTQAGQPLDDWQQDSLAMMLGVRGDGKWSCFEFCEMCPRQNGKGTILEARALAGLFLLGEELIMWSAHEYKTAMEAFRRVLVLLGRLGAKINDNLYQVDGSLVKVNNTNGEEGLERLDTRQRLKFIARSKSSGRGFSGDVNIIDEAFAYTSTQQSALMPTMSARSVHGNPQIIYASSPPLTGESGDVLYLLRYRGDPSSPRADSDPPWSQDDALGFRDWGLAGDLDHLDKVDLDDRQLWKATNPALDIRITQEYVARERRGMSAIDFARERLGIWPRWVGIGSAGWAVITRESWSAREVGRLQLENPVAIGVDVTPDRTWSSIAAAGRRVGGGRAIEVLDHHPGTGWVVRRLRELADRHKPCAVVTSDRALADAAEEAKLTVYRASSADLASAASMLYDGIGGSVPDVHHLPDAELTAAVAGATKRQLGDGWAWDRRSVSVNICPLVACSLALWGLATPRVQTASIAPFALIGD